MSQSIKEILDDRIGPVNVGSGFNIDDIRRFASDGKGLKKLFVAGDPHGGKNEVNMDVTGKFVSLFRSKASCKRAGLALLQTLRNEYGDGFAYAASCYTDFRGVLNGRKALSARRVKTLLRLAEQDKLNRADNEGNNAASGPVRNDGNAVNSSDHARQQGIEGNKVASTWVGNTRDAVNFMLGKARLKPKQIECFWDSFDAPLPSFTNEDKTTIGAKATKEALVGYFKGITMRFVQNCKEKGVKVPDNSEALKSAFVKGALLSLAPEDMQQINELARGSHNVFRNTLEMIQKQKEKMIFNASFALDLAEDLLKSIPDVQQHYLEGKLREEFTTLRPKDMTNISEDKQKAYDQLETRLQDPATLRRFVDACRKMPSSLPELLPVIRLKWFMKTYEPNFDIDMFVTQGIDGALEDQTIPEINSDEDDHKNGIDTASHDQRICDQFVASPAPVAATAI